MTSPLPTHAPESSIAGGATLAELAETAEGHWFSNRPGSDAAFIAAIDEIEARMSPEAFAAFKATFAANPNSNGGQP